ncbi:hypothetical protein PFICI_02139 [Pestalotiopsis fici W106-1]|uniref:Transcription factor domain-containing protein n=1 Tax=Pestalotiopsis fici (strain W106-1 / CGMCC3.15140) TaxID=1229662 RepID=W3XDL6_PESFW|nr:uncharacterized protein PFICI_02139 [Pestalotiopsis fici W106-1]ETS84114.1 hypothetical protein PFICI_02139 [Pestalotiopsis fici W106-1]
MIVCNGRIKTFETSAPGLRAMSEDRMDSLEGKLDQVLARLGSNGASGRATDIPPEVGEPGPTPATGLAVSDSSRNYVPSSFPFNSESIARIGSLYLKWCHRQPVELFNSENFIETLPNRDPELLIALGSLSLRFPPGTSNSSKEEQLEAMTTKCRTMVMERLATSKIELSTLQTLCLLGMLDNTGKIYPPQSTLQAEFNLSMACQLVQSLMSCLGQSNSPLVESRELRLCIRSIFMLQNLYGSLPVVARFMPTIGGGVQATAHLLPLTDFTSSDGDSGDSIKYIAMLTDVWQLARAYAAKRPTTETVPPWAPSSDYSSVMQHHLEIDSRVPLTHRYEKNRIEEYAPEILQQKRDHWGPWLFLQFVYSTIPCLLNHPFLLSLRLANFRDSIPHSFIQQSFENITRNAGWICHFLDVLEDKQFATSDPTLAHCVVIIATIHLQHSFVTTDSDLRESAQKGLQKCMNFLWRMGSTWRIVNTMAEDLERLQESVVATPTPRGPETGNSQAAWTIDTRLLNDLLVQGYSSRSSPQNNSDVFGKSLVPENNISQESGVDFDLVGSVGIFGHRAVPKATPLYAPNKEPRTPFGRTEFITNSPEHPGRLPHAMSGNILQDGWLLSANDYGQAIETWLDSNAPVYN